MERWEGKKKRRQRGGGGGGNKRTKRTKVTCSKMQDLAERWNEPQENKKESWDREKHRKGIMSLVERWEGKRTTGQEGGRGEKGRQVTRKLGEQDNEADMGNGLKRTRDSDSEEDLKSRQQGLGAKRKRRVIGRTQRDIRQMSSIMTVTLIYLFIYLFELIE